MTQHPSIVGIDLAKRMFHLVGMDDTGHVVLRKRLTRDALMPYMGLPKDSRKNGHSLSECCNGVVFGLCQLRGHRIGCSRLRQQHSAYQYRYRMGSWPTARIRRALGRSIPPKNCAYNM